MELSRFFQEHPKAALAFSGGVDSAYLLYAACRAGAQVRAYYIKTAFQPRFELDDACRLAQQLGADLQVINADILSCPEVTANPADRCYHCKKQIFSAISRAAQADGFDLILDGTNASDRADDRPGMRALREMAVRSPLREAGLTKAMIRELSRQAGLFTWDKPAYACLATRIPTGIPIRQADLTRTEEAEDFLMQLGFSGFRVRLLGDSARLQLPPEQLPLLLEKREEILRTLKQYYTNVFLDLEVRLEQ